MLKLLNITEFFFKRNIVKGDNDDTKIPIEDWKKEKKSKYKHHT